MVVSCTGIYLLSVIMELNGTWSSRCRVVSTFGKTLDSLSRSPDPVNLQALLRAVPCMNYFLFTDGLLTAWDVHISRNVS